MADLLFCDFERRWREKREGQSEVDDFTDKELRSRYCFGRDCLFFFLLIFLSDILCSTRSSSSVVLKFCFLALRAGAGVAEVILRLFYCRPEAKQAKSIMECYPRINRSAIRDLSNTVLFPS